MKFEGNSRLVLRLSKFSEIVGDFKSDKYMKILS